MAEITLLILVHVRLNMVVNSGEFCSKQINRILGLEVETYFFDVKRGNQTVAKQQKLCPKAPLQKICNIAVFAIPSFIDKLFQN